MSFRRSSVKIVLRFMWLSTLIPPQFGDHHIWLPPEYLSPLIEALEIIRRFIWGLLRVEYEHLHNASGFRRVDFVPMFFDLPQKARANRSGRRPSLDGSGRRPSLDAKNAADASDELDDDDDADDARCQQCRERCGMPSSSTFMPIYEIFFALGCVIVISLATLLWNVAHESDSTPIIVLDDDVDDATRVDYNGTAAAAKIVDIVDDRLDDNDDDSNWFGRF